MELKNIFTSYWNYLPLYAACKLELFDAILQNQNTVIQLSKNLELHRESLEIFVRALEKLEVIKINNKKIELTPNGLQLTENHHKTLKYACLHWGEEHLSTWQNMGYTLRTGKPAFEHLFQKPFFTYLSIDKKRLENYHKAMNEYARDDYSNICDILDLEEHQNILDVGGGLGALISIIASKFPQKNCALFDKPEVINISNRKNIEKIGGDFFREIPVGFDAIIMSRVLHDWNDEDANRILKNVNKSLQDFGKLYVIENLTQKTPDNAALLSLNMLLVTKSYERTLNQYSALLNKASFGIIETKQINQFQHVLICKKVN